jgi:catechol 2,3-dioxygenase-like lactoylglutathione lyase family enzyme
MERMNIEHVALQVPDPAAMADWYVNHLGCSIKRSTGEPSFIRFLMDGSGDAMMELYRNPRVAVPDYQSMDPMLVHIAFVSPDPERDRDRLVAAGASVADDYTKTPAGDELVMLRDPWGIALQLVKRANPMLTR